MPAVAGWPLKEIQSNYQADGGVSMLSGLVSGKQFAEDSYFLVMVKTPFHPDSGGVSRSSAMRCRYSRAEKSSGILAST